MDKPVQASPSSPLKLALTRAEVILILLVVVLGAGAWIWIDREMGTMPQMAPPRQDQAQREFNVAGMQAALTRADNEGKAVQDQLVQARLEVFKQSAALQGYESTYPQLKSAAPAAVLSATLPSGTAAAYLDTRVRLDAAQRLEKALSDHLVQLDDQVAQAGAQLAQAQDNAQQRYNEEQAGYLMKRPAWSLAAGLGVIAVLVALMALVQWRLVHGSPANRPPIANPLLPWAAAALLLILFAYQAFDIAGATFALIFVLLAALAGMSWKGVKPA